MTISCDPLDDFRQARLWAETDQGMKLIDARNAAHHVLETGFIRLIVRHAQFEHTRGGGWRWWACIRRQAERESSAPEPASGIATAGPHCKGPDSINMNSSIWCMRHLTYGKAS
jgi:hypothetical protein